MSADIDPDCLIPYLLFILASGESDQSSKSLLCHFP